MAGSDLSNGSYLDSPISKEDFWRVMNQFFSSKSRKNSSYKYVFFDSLLFCIKNMKNENDLSFYDIFRPFVELYWVFVLRYGIRQNLRTRNGTKTEIEKILYSYENRDNRYREKLFNDLPFQTQELILNDSVEACSRYVIGAVYQDSDKMLYSFSKQKKLLQVNPGVLPYLLEYHNKLIDMNHRALAAFWVKVNSNSSEDEFYGILQDLSKEYKSI